MGEDSDDSGISGPAQAETPDGPPPRHALDPAVESVWLGRRSPPRLGRPRLSTLLLTAAFIAVLALYLTVR
ncbi:hypothetical protein [Nocardia bovistercoris]|uniref:Uncharacterized protein n=1 Tax=Nocardia bovistercoris TaxID=2785916 RepID=A0A931I7Q0_9NOCA|nr:hypothetical protein [Nocardia bovistercoris]MBH0775606.1 hypothetical protein [Nocardia bovistercoris]